VAIGANLVLGAAIASLFAANRLPTDGSWAMGASLAGIGIVFAAIAAITAQMFQSARASNSLAGAVIGVSFLVRGIGDAMGTVATDGLSVASAWPTWFSPIGWGQQMHPFAEITWRPLILVVVAAVALSGLAFYLTAHRDVGLGIFAD